jgi:hypothetical protein
MILSLVNVKGGVGKTRAHAYRQLGAEAIRRARKGGLL